MLAIAGALIEANADEGISTDELMVTSGLTSEEVRGALYDLERLGIAGNDTVLTAFVHRGVQASLAGTASSRRLRLRKPSSTSCANGPRAWKGGDTSPLHLRLATQRLKDDGHAYALPELLRRIVRGIAADGRGEGGGGGSLGVRGRDGETIHVTLQRDWQSLKKTAELRRAAAGRLLDHLLASLPPDSRGTDLLAETTLGKPTNSDHLRLDPEKRGQGSRQAHGPRPALAARAGGRSSE